MQTSHPCIASRSLRQYEITATHIIATRALQRANSHDSLDRILHFWPALVTSCAASAVHLISFLLLLLPHTMDSLSSTLQASHLSQTLEPHRSSVPTTLTRSYSVNSVPTDIWVQLFSDRIMCGVSQVNTKVGTFLSCHIDESIIDNRIRFIVTPLLGKRNDAVLEVFCRQVTEQIAALRTTAAAACPPVLMGISLKNKDPETFRILIELVVKLYKEAIAIASSSR